MMLRALPIAVFAWLFAATPVLAHHISGTVFCDTDYDGVIDNPGDGRLSGLNVRATSLDAAPGQTFNDTTDGTGAYNIGLPARTDRYLVEITNLPGGFTIVLPAGDTYTIQIITGTAQDHADNVNFLVQGCAPPPTTTSTTTTSTTTSAPTSTTTTTLVPPCSCAETPFLVNREGRINNDASVHGSVGTNAPGGSFKLGKNVVMADATTLTAFEVEVGQASSVFDVRAVELRTGPEATIRGTIGTPTLPIVEPFCTIPDFDCGTQSVLASLGSTVSLAPGSYGQLRILNDATVLLAPGTYEFCGVKLGRGAHLETQGPATINITGSLTIGSGSRLGPASGAPLPIVNVAGRKLRVSQGGEAEAAIFAPNAKTTLGRDSLVEGCFCSDSMKSDKHITLVCVETP